MHWTYEDISNNNEDLRQGDILEPSEALIELFKDVHSHFTHKKYRGFLIISQTCDLAKRQGKCGATHINLSVIRSLQDIISDSLKDHFGYLAPGIYNLKMQPYVKTLAERMVNQNENGLGLFYLHPELDAGITVPSVAVLRVSISVKAASHYDKLIKARVGRLSKEFQPKLGWMVGNLYSRVGVPDWKEKKGDSEKGSIDENQVVNDILSFSRREQPIWLDKKIFQKITEDKPGFESLSQVEQDEIIKSYQPLPLKEEILEIIANTVTNVMPNVKATHIDILKQRLNNSDLFESKLKKFGKMET